MKTYIVQKPITLGYDSHSRAPTPSRYKTHKEGSKLTLSSEAPNGNVWFFDESKERGKIECGEVANLVNDGSVRLAEK